MLSSPDLNTIAAVTVEADREQRIARVSVTVDRLAAEILVADEYADRFRIRLEKACDKFQEALEEILEDYGVEPYA